MIDGGLPMYILHEKLYKNNSKTFCDIFVGTLSVYRFSKRYEHRYTN